MQNPADPARTSDSLPFSDEEYRERQRRVRLAMENRGIDLLYITRPENLFYLTGYEAIWYPPRLPLGAVLERARADMTSFDWSRHQGSVSTRVRCDDVVLFD